MATNDHIATIKEHLKAISDKGFYYVLRQLEKKMEHYTFSPCSKGRF